MSELQRSVRLWRFMHAGARWDVLRCYVILRSAAMVPENFHALVLCTGNSNAPLMRPVLQANVAQLDSLVHVAQSMAPVSDSSTTLERQPQVQLHV